MIQPVKYVQCQNTVCYRGFCAKMLRLMKRLPKDEVRDEVISGRYTAGERADVTTAAKMTGVSTRTFIRVAALKAARAEIRKAGKTPATG
jgi:glucose-6-phosphate 1-dehydrogenase